MNEYDYIKNAFTKEGDNTNLEVNNLNVTCITSKDNKFLLDSEGNLTVKSINVKDGLLSENLLNAMYPIGSIYISVNDKNPTTLFGGTWEQIKDRFLLSCGDTYQNGVTGGEEKHILTKNELPKFNFVCPVGDNTGHGTTAQVTPYTYTNDWATIGGGQAHNNMPPYLSVYIWKRVS